MVVGKYAGLAIVLAALTHMSWNLFAPDLFGLPRMRMNHALGVIVFAGVIGVLLRQPYARSDNGA